MISLLFAEEINELKKFNEEEPVYFRDLYLDKVYSELNSSSENLNLKKYFYTTLDNIQDIHYRQNIFRELEDKELFQNILYFIEDIKLMKKYLKLVESFYFQEQKNIWFLYSAEIYCNSLKKLNLVLSKFEIKSAGFRKFRNYLIEYLRNPKFISLYNEIKTIKEGLLRVKFRVLIGNNSFSVHTFKEGKDYNKKINNIFQKFNTNISIDIKFDEERSPMEMNYIEAKIIEFVSNLYPDLFQRLENFNIMYKNFADDGIMLFFEEIHFYILYIQFINKLKKQGLKFCYPTITNSSKEIFAKDSFDIALANENLKNNQNIVTNDFYLKGEERIIIVTGPNQGGKTTFARMFGQLHYLALLGLPIPGTNALIFLADNIFTFFEREEKVGEQRGKLEDDLIRIHHILNKATSNSIIIVNEIFNSTTLHDMIFLSQKVLKRIFDLDSICVWVTFADELTNFSNKIVSMTSITHPENPSKRTFKILRNRANGLAYAKALLEKYNLSKEKIKMRIMNSNKN